MILWMQTISGGKNDRLRFRPFLGSVLLILSVSFFSFLHSSPCAAEPVLTIDGETQYRFAEQYFSTRDYMRAVDEYKRYIYFFPESEKVEEAWYQIGMARFRLGQFDEAVAAFREILEKYPNSDFYLTSYFKIGDCYARQSAFGQAIIHLRNLIALTDDMAVQDEAAYRIGWIYVEMADWEKARHAFERISENNARTYQVEQLMAELNPEHLIKKKNPRTAAALSIFPGAGYLYTERYQDALVAFLLNTGLILAAYECFDNDLNALGAVITFVEIGFYTGSIYGSIASAHKYNRLKINRFIETLKQNSKINLSTGMKEHRVMLTYQFNF